MQKSSLKDVKVPAPSLKEGEVHHLEVQILLHQMEEVEVAHHLEVLELLEVEGVQVHDLLVGVEVVVLQEVGEQGLHALVEVEVGEAPLFALVVEVVYHLE